MTDGKEFNCDPEDIDFKMFERLAVPAVVCINSRQKIGARSPFELEVYHR